MFVTRFVGVSTNSIQCFFQLKISVYICEKRKISLIVTRIILTTDHYETGRFILNQQRRMAGCYQGQVQEKSENSFLCWVGSLDTFPDYGDNDNVFWAFYTLFGIS